MAKEHHVEMEGEVVNCGAGGIFCIKCEGGHTVLAKLSGRMRKNRIRVVLGDQVIVAVSPYDPKRGLITYRKR
ncbi:MAG: translation initiation factor IF-1 [Candidatus Binatia bacterium]